MQVIIVENQFFKGGYRHGFCNCLFLYAFLPGFIVGIYSGVSVNAVYGFEWYSVLHLNSSKLFCVIYLALPFLICPFCSVFKTVLAFIRAFILIRALTCGYVFYVSLVCFGMKSAFFCVLFDFILSFILCEFTDTFSSVLHNSSANRYLPAAFSVIAFAVTLAFILY